MYGWGKRIWEGKKANRGITRGREERGTERSTEENERVEPYFLVDNEDENHKDEYTNVCQNFLLRFKEKVIPAT